MPDKVFKSDELKDSSSGLVLTDPGPEEKFAGNVLKSLKEKISEARQELQDLQQEIEESKQEAEDKRDQILEDARSEAEQIKEEAEEEARQLVNSREQEVDQARQEGHEEGYEEGWDKARRETAEMIEHGENILDEARRERQAFVAEHKQELVNLAVSFAEKVVRRTVEVDDGIALRVVESALDEVRDVKEITLVLNPEDYERVSEVIDDFREEHPSLEEITISPDENMDRGGCRIKTDYGDLDGSIRGQLDHLADELLESF